VVDLARNLGITVIAEGVDHEAQVQFLLERGCEEMQGFLIAHPLPAAEMAAFLADRRFEPGAPTVIVPRSA
jgi:diguanylate cyclase